MVTVATNAAINTFGIVFAIVYTIGYMFWVLRAKS